MLYPCSQQSSLQHHHAILLETLLLCCLQFHVAQGPTAHRMPPGGAVGLVLPDVSQIVTRLEALQQGRLK